MGKHAYPHLLVMTGFHDTQVQYWEPVKWVAKLRANKTDQNLILFEMDMNAGHNGAGQGGRFQMMKINALQFAFYLMLEAKQYKE